MHGAADQALADLGETIEALEGRLAEHDRQRLRAAMGAEAFEAECVAGRALDTAEVLAALGPKDAAVEWARKLTSSWSSERAVSKSPVVHALKKLVATNLESSAVIAESPIQ